MSIDKTKQSEDEEEEKNKWILLLGGILGVILDPAQIIEQTAEKIVIDLAYDLSYELIAQALNNNPELWQAGVRGVRFEGDKHNILLQDPLQFSPAQVGKGPQQDAAPSPPKIKPKKTRWIWGILISLFFIFSVLGGFILDGCIFEPPPTSPPLIPIINPPDSTEPPPTQPPVEPPPTQPPVEPPPTQPPTDPMNAKISGLVSEDVGGDGNIPLVGETITLGLGACNSSGFQSMVTGGINWWQPESYSFTGLSAGAYCVKVQIPDPCSLQAVTSNPVTVVLDPGEKVLVHFTFKDPLC